MIGSSRATPVRPRHGRRQKAFEIAGSTVSVVANTVLKRMPNMMLYIKASRVDALELLERVAFGGTRERPWIHRVRVSRSNQ